MFSEGAHVPWKEDEHRSHGNLPDKPLEARLRLAIRILESVLADLQEVLAPLDSRSNLLCAVGNGPAHLRGEFEGQLIRVVCEPPEALFDDCLPVCQ